MADTRAAVEEFLAGDPDRESALRELLSVDERESGWEFHDLSMDSGTFGEVVASGIVVDADDGDGYTVADRAAVRAVLDGEAAGGSADPEAASTGASVPDVSTDAVRDLALPTVDRYRAQLVGALAVLVACRAYIYPAVFRKGDVVLLSNDPYAVRYQLDRFVQETSSPLDVGTIVTGVSGSNSLFEATLWWVAELFGGTPAAVGPVMAWYPVVAAVVIGVATYLFATRVTDDPRVGVTAVVMLAVTPALAFRTALGFADHHAFDYAWLSLVVLGLVVLAETTRDDLRDRRTWLATGFFGAAVAGYALSWSGSPIGLVPVGGYVAVRALVDLRDGESPLWPAVPVVAGLALATAVVATMHVGFGWTNSRVLVAVPLLFAGSVVPPLIAEGARRVGLGVRTLAGAEVGLGALGFAVLATVEPFASFVASGVGYFQRTGDRYIAETLSLVGGPGGLFSGPLFMFGFILFFSVPYLVWVTGKLSRSRRPAWLVPTVYCWYLLVLSLFVQRRFTGELSIPLALFAAIAFVHVGSKVDVLAGLAVFEDESDATGPPRGRPARAAEPDGGRGTSDLRAWLSELDARGVLSVVALFALLCGVSLLQVTIYVNFVLVDGDRHDAARQMERYADEQGWTYPDNYVFSPWGENRMYNYFVNGDEPHPQSLWYGYARGNYAAFLLANDSTRWYERLGNHGAGFVVVGDRESAVPERSVQTHLHDDYGSHTDGMDAVAHYRLIWAAPDGSPKAFALVPGATLSGTGPANATADLSTTVSVEGAEFTYRRVVRTNATGHYTATVPYPGRYDLANRTVSVSERAVHNGTERSGLAWSTP